MLTSNKAFLWLEKKKTYFFLSLMNGRHFLVTIPGKKTMKMKFFSKNIF